MTNRTDFKNLLRGEIENNLKKKLLYFSRDELRSVVLEGRPSTLNRYMVDLNKKGVLYGVGRGWYSFIARPFELELKPVKKIVSLIEKKYPLLSFSAWSTEQLRSFAHYMLTRFIIFIYTDRDSIGGVYAFLKGSGYDVWLNPRGKDLGKFNVGERTVVIRPSISRERSNEHFAGIEKILVDLFVEAPTLNIMDEDECYRILRNVITSGRIDIGALINYAKRRKLRTKGFVKLIKSI